MRSIMNNQTYMVKNKNGSHFYISRDNTPVGNGDYVKERAFNLAKKIGGKVYFDTASTSTKDYRIGERYILINV